MNLETQESEAQVVSACTYRSRHVCVHVYVCVNKESQVGECTAELSAVRTSPRILCDALCTGYSVSRHVTWIFIYLLLYRCHIVCIHAIVV